MRTKFTRKTRVGLWGQTIISGCYNLVSESSLSQYGVVRDEPSGSWWACNDPVPKRVGARVWRPDQRAAMRDVDGGRNEPDPHPNERGFRGCTGMGQYS